MQSSAFERMKLSLFRSKTDLLSGQSGRKSRAFSNILSPTRANKSGQSTPSPSPAPRPNSDLVQLPTDPTVSPVGPYPDRRSASDAGLPSPRELDDSVQVDNSLNQDERAYSDATDPEDRSMMRKLDEMDSSFSHSRYPNLTAQRSVNLGVSEKSRTYLPNQRKPVGAQESPSKSRRSITWGSCDEMPQQEDGSIPPSSSPSGVFKTPATGPSHFPRSVQRISEEDEVEYGDSSIVQSQLQHSLSSPSAAAAQRSRLRAAAAGASPTQLGESPGSSQPRPQTSSGQLSTREEGQDYTQGSMGSFKRAMPSGNQGHLKPSSDPVSMERRDLKDDAPPVTASEPASGKLSTQEMHQSMPQESQRTSTSSMSSNNEPSDNEIQTEDEYATGEATPGSHSTVRADHELSRLPSLGSATSSTSIHTDHSSNRQKRRNVAGSRDGNLERLVEEERAKSQSPQATPVTSSFGRADPTITAIAQKVQNLEVPSTVVRNYTASHAQKGPKDHIDSSSPFFGRTKNNLTLKEQNSRIDKLSKENFDLKLKIHYLYQALQDRSEEGVKEMISSNAQLQADLLKSKKDNQSLRKHVKELERGGPRPVDGGTSSHAPQEESEDAHSSQAFRQEQTDNEISYLRDQVQLLRDRNDALQSSTDSSGLLMDEKRRREQAEERARMSEIELGRVRNSRSPLRHFRWRSSEKHLGPPSQAQLKESMGSWDKSGETLVDHLRQENDDLRRDLGAQTSMLTSRNKERQRLEKEIEELKLMHRRGDNVNPRSPDSLFERSSSRSNLRSPSRQGASTRLSQLSESDKDQYEATQANLRDENLALRLKNQDLQADLNVITESAEHLENLRAERDEAIRLLDEERDVAVETVDTMEELIDQKEQEIHNLLSNLRNQEDESNSLHQEIKAIGNSLTKVVDDCETSQATIQHLRHEVSSANGEMELAEQSLQEMTTAKDRLEVQAESSQNEITFLREEQEGDKMKISDLQSVLDRAKTNVRDEKERFREIEKLGAEAQTAREETRLLRKALAAKEDEVSGSREDLEEFEEGLRRALDNSEDSRATLLTHVSLIQRDLDATLKDLSESKRAATSKDRDLQDRDKSLQSHARESRRLTEVLEKERQARKRHQTELERLRANSEANAQLAELENGWAQDREQFAALEERYVMHLRERNTLLFELWSRLSSLCGPEWLEQHCSTSGVAVPTFESASANLPAFDQVLQTAIDAIENTLSNIRTRIRSTEKDIYKDFESLEQDLTDRSKRMDRMEKVMQRSSATVNAQPNGTTAPTVPKAELARLKDENKLLRRELKILKQGAFALPGLPSPQEELDRAAAAAATIERQREGGAPPKSPSKGRARDAAGIRRHRQKDSNSTDVGALDGSHEMTGVTKNAGHTRNESEETARDATQGSERVGGDALISNDHPTLAPSEQRWILRLKELERRLRAEREARLLDRSGARKRLEEGRAENEGLKRELERERSRARIEQIANGANGVEGGVGEKQVQSGSVH